MLIRVAQAVQLFAALGQLSQSQLIERLQRAATHFFASGDYELASELRDLAAQLAMAELREGSKR